MKQLFFAGLLSILLVPHFSYAADHAVEKQQHHHAHASAHSKSDNTQPVNINSADVTQLTTLKGIGAKKAEAIVSYRTTHGPFKTANDLAHVKGIGVKAVARLQANNPNRLVVNSSGKIG